MAGFSAVANDACVNGFGRLDVESSEEFLWGVSRVDGLIFLRVRTFEFGQCFYTCQLVPFYDLTRMQTHDEQMFGFFQQFPS